MNRPWRKVIGWESYRYYKAHGDTVVLKLECGHETSRKDSQCRPTVPKKVRCLECRYYNNEDNSIQHKDQQ